MKGYMEGVVSDLAFLPLMRYVAGMTVESLRQMPRSEKLKLMERLWEELSRPEGGFESPAWHASELAATERRLAEGKEQVLDWDTAKQSLRGKLR
jgi:hypothetical protein